MAPDSTPDSTQKAPTPRTIRLPLGGEALVFTREMVTVLLRCSHGELGRLLQRKMFVLPIRVDGLICWFQDETMTALPQAIRTLERWRNR